MSKVRRRTQPLSCSRHKRNGCKAQAALPTMMSGLDGCLRADVTWVGSGEKGESFHVCFSAAQCWLGTVAEQGSAWSASVIICSIGGMFVGEKVVSTPQKSYIVVNYLIRCIASRRIGASS